MVEFFTTRLRGWISLNLKFDGGGIKRWSSVWDITWHTAWMWRNKEEHDDTYVRPNEPMHHILQKSIEYENAKTWTSKVTRIEVGNQNMGWKPPPLNMVKLNSCGVSKENNSDDYGGVIKDDRGAWVSEFSKYLGALQCYYGRILGCLWKDQAY